MPSAFCISIWVSSRTSISFSRFFPHAHPPDENGNAASLFPAEINADTDVTEELRKQVGQHPLVANKLLSEDAKRALIVVALKPNGTAVSNTCKI